MFFISLYSSSKEQILPSSEIMGRPKKRSQMCHRQVQHAPPQGDGSHEIIVQSLFETMFDNIKILIAQLSSIKFLL